ncbi:unnamed protein product (macronuclear) [Paramecium tetraurelia]|uniref:Protein kinase domain-containing protein n=1 Tax=Paramecium tetraurelia TaxID=5888 RepID=A0BW49_PARTE|nr:uncharacterized protein GSPATT00032618001 [Paramecium tetraurelia]CAK62766.1 unnamed protein product [Paramecium tetraurelia]|eukprot:XP_001430164.1 hypothetical protein (macronuclear) [Paramecium tetraurelia strain d4-2]
MGCCMKGKAHVAASSINASQRQTKKFDTQRSRVDEMKFEVFEKTMYGNEDNYYDSDELTCIDRNQLLSLIKSEPKKIRWTPGQVIGQGSFGRVIEAMNLDTGKLMAVKQVMVGIRNEDRIMALEIEIDLLSLIKHKNIVSYYGMERTEKTLNIFLERVAGGSLSSMLQKFGSFQESLIKVYMRQILQGLEYLHQNGIMHRDIKGANVLVDNQGVCKLADFGSSKKIALNSDSTIFGTPNFMAPEVVQQQKSGRKADIWSLGCTMIELATGKPPWHEITNQFAVMIRIGKGEIPQIPEGFSEEAKSFVSHCLEVDERKRWNATKLLKHPFLIQQNKLEIPQGKTSLRNTPGSKSKQQQRSFKYPEQETSHSPGQAKEFEQQHSDNLQPMNDSSFVLKQKRQQE